MERRNLESLHAEHVTRLATRVAPLLENRGFDALLVHSGLPQKRSRYDDQFWPLRATPHFQHWLPLAEPDCAVWIEPGRKPTLFWTKSQSFWETPPTLGSRHWLASFDIVELDSLKDAKDRIRAGDRRVAWIGEEAERAGMLGFAQAAIDPEELLGDLDSLRTLKTAYEIECLAEANRIASKGHDALRAMFAAGGHSELDLHLAYLKTTYQDDPETPYKNIVAAGANAATLHHVSYGRQPGDEGGNQSLLVDAGATVFGYCSDITRTWIRGNGATASVFAELVAGVERFQQALCGAVSIGKSYELLHDEAHRYVASVLRDIGVVRCSAEEAVEKGISRAFFPHGLGHSLGLQCHDVGCALIKPRDENPFLRNTAPITKDQVFTIEPGIYFIGSLLSKLKSEPGGNEIDWALCDALAPFGGVRIEDDVVVTEGTASIRNLTREVLPVGGGAAKG